MHEPKWKSANFRSSSLHRKEYYDKWYMKVNLWNVEKVKLKDRNQEINVLKKNPDFIYKNMYNFN